MSEDATLDEFVEAESDSSESEAENLARKTVCGIPPQDWTVARLGELVRVVSGNSLPTEYQNGKEGEHPVYKVSDMNTIGNQKYVSETSNRLSKDDLEEINHTLYPEGTIILPKVGAALLTNKRRMLTEPSSFDNNVMGWVPEEINPEFLYYVSCMIDMEAVAQKGAVPSISKAIAKSLKLPSPPLPEQRKIATVLYTVDRVIGKTEEIITQNKRVSSGIKQDILTTGLEDSPTRPVRIVSQEVEVCSEWDMVPLPEIAEDGDDTFTDGDWVESEDMVENGEYQLIQLGNVGEGRFKGECDRYVNQDFFESENCTLVEKGDLLISRMAEPILRTVIVPEFEKKSITAVDIVVAKVDEEEWDKRYLTYLLNTKTWENIAEALASGSTRKRISRENMSRILVPKPNIDVQKAIADTIESVEKSIEVERENRQQLRRLKRGLMQDLLSGKVRTTDTNIEVPEEIAQHG